MKWKTLFAPGLALAFLLPGLMGYGQDTIPVRNLPPVTVTATTKRIPEKVWSNFQKYFADAENPRWYTLNKNYLVKFMLNENDNRALFTKRGNLIYNISYGYESFLPDDLRSQVRHGYLDYNITRVIKVNEANREIWVVNLEDADNYVIVRLEDGDMEEVQKMKRS